MAGIRAYWWENISKINKRTGTTIPDPRVAVSTIIFENHVNPGQCPLEVTKNCEKKLQICITTQTNFVRREKLLELSSSSCSREKTVKPTKPVSC